MKTFYVITNQTKDPSLEMTKKMKEYIESQGGNCVLASEVPTIPEGVDGVLVLGGDGTIIRAARELASYDAPILGINMGRVGYLTEAEASNLKESLDSIMQGKTWVEERMMLKGSINGKKENVALNDIILSRSGALRLLEFHVYVNGELLNTYHADGVIVATPTGSTAYNLSAGGPVVDPVASMIVITPICSHALNTSSIVLSADDEVTIAVGEGRDGNKETACLSFDGECNEEVHTGDKIVIRKAEETTKLFKLNKISFLEILRKKMKGN